MTVVGPICWEGQWQWRQQMSDGPGQTKELAESLTIMARDQLL